VVEDKNSPKQLEIEYDADVQSEPDFLIMEKSYTQMKRPVEPVKAKVAAAAPAGAPADKDKKPAGPETADEKRLARQLELLAQYD